MLNFFPEEKLIFFPADELLRAEALSSSKELMAQRLYAMEQCLEAKDSILIVHPSSAMRFLPNAEEFGKRVFHFKVGERYNLDDLRKTLTEMGYHRVNKIDQTLQFASRGDILDIFSVNYPNPIRIEFFDDEIESIKSFSISTQLSTNPLQNAVILPATDVFLSDAQIESFKERIAAVLSSDSKHLSASAFESLENNVNRDIENIEDRVYSPQLYKYFGFALNENSNIFSYFKPALTYVADKDAFEDSCESLASEAHSYYSELHDSLRIPTHLEEYIELDNVLPTKGVKYGSKFAMDPDDFNFLVRHIVSAGTGIASMVSTIQSYVNTNETVIIALDQPQQIETLKSFLDDEKVEYEDTKGFELPKGKLGISKASLNEGFEIPAIGVAVLSSSELLAKEQQQRDSPQGSSTRRFLRAMTTCVQVTMSFTNITASASSSKLQRWNKKAPTEII